MIGLRSATRRTVAALVVVGGVLVLAATPAAAGGVDWVRYAGASINGQKVPATVVTLDAVSASAAAKVQFLVGGRLLAEDTTVVPSGTSFLASAAVDLTGLRGRTVVRARYVSVSGAVRSVDKSFTAVAPQAATPPTPSTPPSAAGPAVLRGAANTGVPAGTRLTPSGSVTVTKDGTVLDGLDVTGCVSVRAKDVTIRRSRIRCDAAFGQLAVELTDAGDRLVLEDVEVDGQGTTETCIGWSRYTLRRVNVHGCADGARFGHRVTIEDSWLHDNARIRDYHSDALQTTSASDVVIRGNTLDPTDTARKDLNNAAIMLGSETGTRAVRRVLIENNRLDGGNYSLNVRGDITAEAVTIRHNVFGSAARYGPVLTPATVPLAEGNVMTGSSQAVRVVRAR